MAKALTDRWTPCRLDPRQLAYLNSRSRITVVPAGRRSWKTEGAKRRLVSRAIMFHRYPDGRFFACAPTHQQACDIFWSDLVEMVPQWALRTGSYDRDISLSTKTIYLYNGAIIRVAGLDKPARIEGKDWDGGVVDEFADCKPEVLEEHIMPMLARGGYVDVIGVPGGRNHYYRLAQNALSGEMPNASCFTWTAAEVLHLYLGKERADEFLAQMRKQMDPLTYDQEFNASFVTFEGRVYYGFSRDVHAIEPLRYDPDLPLILCFDFNVAPGVCGVVQEKLYCGPNARVAGKITAVVDEIWISRNSNTKKVCGLIVERYGGHRGLVYCYGDATGGASGSAKVEGSDWELIKAALKPVFADRLRFRVPAANPRERVRVNAVNTRFENAAGEIHMLIDPKCLHTIVDFDGVTCTDDGSGDIDKGADPQLTHLSDAIGYYVAEAHPVVQHLSEWSQH
jgi:hypothetical protein